jgi:hypothetical protein
MTLLLNVRCLLRDRKVAGVSLLPTAWFSAWGIWNAYFYWHLGLILSWSAGVAVVLVNATWVGLALWFGRKIDS